MTVLGVSFGTRNPARIRARRDGMSDPLLTIGSITKRTNEPNEPNDTR